MRQKILNPRLIKHLLPDYKHIGIVGILRDSDYAEKIYFEHWTVLRTLNGPQVETWRPV